MAVPLKELLADGMGIIYDQLGEVVEDTEIYFTGEQQQTAAQSRASAFATISRGTASAETAHIIPVIWFSANIEEERLRGVVGASNRIADYKLLVNIPLAAQAAELSVEQLIVATKAEAVVKRISQGINYEVIEQNVGLTGNKMRLRVIGQS